MPEKRLYLSRSNRMIGGVAGGIAEYFQIDPTVVRIVLLLLLLPGGAGLIAYIAAMIIIPEAPRETRSSSKSFGSETSTGSEPEQDEEAILELKQAARELAEAGSEVASDAAARVRASLTKLNTQKDHKQEGTLQRSEDPDEKDSDKVVGLVLIGLGFFFLARTFIPWIPWNALWPVALIIIGGVMLLGGVGDRR